MRRFAAFTATVLWTLAFAGSLQAQSFALDTRGVAAVADRFGGSKLDMGFGIGATLSYRLQPYLAAYGGWDWLRFSADESFAGNDVEFVENGSTVGLRYERPFGDGHSLYRFEAGLTYKHVEVEDAGGCDGAQAAHHVRARLGQRRSPARLLRREGRGGGACDAVTSA